MGQQPRGKGSCPRAKSRQRNRVGVCAGQVRAACGRTAAQAHPADGADRGRRRGRFRRGRPVSGAGRRRRDAQRVRRRASSEDRRSGRVGRTALGRRAPRPGPSTSGGCRRPPPRQAPCPAGSAHRCGGRPPRGFPFDGASTVGGCVEARRIRLSRHGGARKAPTGLRGPRGSPFGSPGGPVAAGRRSTATADHRRPRPVGGAYAGRSARGRPGHRSPAVRRRHREHGADQARRRGAPPGHRCRSTARSRPGGRSGGDTRTARSPSARASRRVGDRAGCRTDSADATGGAGAGPRTRRRAAGPSRATANVRRRPHACRGPDGAPRRTPGTGERAGCPSWPARRARRPGRRLRRQWIDARAGAGPATRPAVPPRCRATLRSRAASGREPNSCWDRPPRLRRVDRPRRLARAAGLFHPAGRSISARARPP